MEAEVEKLEGPGGATAEAVTLTFGGRAFTALGACVDHGKGTVTGYVSADGRHLTSFAGAVLGTLRLVSKFRTRRLHGPVETFCYRAEVEGRRYHGRGSGPGMILHLRASK